MIILRMRTNRRIMMIGMMTTRMKSMSKSLALSSKAGGL
jgi:hypothetical protein